MNTGSSSIRQILPLRLPRAGDWAVPVIYLLVGVIAYGLLIPGLGFFWDDWPNAWFLHAFGPTGFPLAFASDRPVIGYVYVLTTSLVGTSPTAWHLFALGWRIAAALSLWHVLRRAIPGAPRQAAWAGLLFLVYPSFQQQYVSIIYSHFFLLASLHLVSIALTVRAVGSRRPIPWTLAALAGQALSLFSVEYFVHLEVLRLGLLALVLTRSGPPARRSRFLKAAAPYLALTGIYLVWRVAGHGFPTYELRLLGDLQTDPGGAIAGLVALIRQDLAQMLGEAWASAATFPDPGSFGLRATLFVAGAGLAALIVAAWFCLTYRREETSSTSLATDLRLAGLLVGLGLLLLLAGGITVWLTGLPIGLGFPWDRLTLLLLAGACLATVGALTLLHRPRWLAPGLMAIAIGLSVVAQVRAGFSFRRDWEAQRDFFWQLAWRAPAIAPGTLLLTNDIPFEYESDNSLTGPLNWIYAAAPPDPDMDYMLYFVSIRLGLGLPSLDPGQPVEQWYRPTTFHGNTSQSLVVLSNPPGCVQVLDEVLHDSMPTVPRDLSQAVPLASLEWIDPAAPLPRRTLETLFGPEPAPGWCYYFESAEAARQREDWAAVVALGEAGLATGDEPNDASEWLPFIEANARVGNVQRAVQLTRDSLDRNHAVIGMLCRTWGRLAPDLPGLADRQRGQQMLQELGCD